MPGHPAITKKLITGIAVTLLSFILGITASGWNYTAAVADAGPDLVVQEITLSPKDPAIDEIVTITVAIKNQGTAEASISHIVCYADSTILSTATISPLAAGTMTTVQFTWKAQPGPHTIKAIADSSEVIAETDETNNTKTFNLTTLAADLIVQSITWTPQNPSMSDNIVFSVTVKNQGSSRSQLTNLNLYIDGNSRGYQDVAALNAGATLTLPYNWVAQAGQHALKAVVDEVSNVKESNESNNEKTVTFTTLPPDLFVQTITWSPENPSKDDVVTFTALVKNQGNGWADTTHLGYFIDDNFQSTVAVSALTAGASVNVTFTWRALPDAHIIKAVVDYYKKITESDENNNEKTVNFSTLPPDLIVKDITWLPTNAAIGDTVTFTITIKNQGGGKAEPSRAACYIDGHFECYLIIPAIDADGEVAQTYQWRATGGSHVINIVADDDNKLMETNKENNKLSKTVPIIPPDLTVSNIVWSPENPSLGDTVTFTVTISNQGGGRAENFYIAYYLDDAELNSQNIARVDYGVSVNATCTWQAQTGRHTFKAVVDYDSHVPEDNENNNEKSVTIVPNMPDLAIGKIIWSPAEIAAGSDITFDINIENVGGVSAGPSRLTYYVDGSAAGYADVAQVDAGAAVMVRFVWAAIAGPHSIEIVADSANKIHEIDETNNSKVVNIPPPDLIIQDISWSPANASIGDTVTIKATVINQGKGKSPKSGVTCSVDSVLVGSGELPEIDPAGSVTKNFPWKAVAGTHSIKLVADASNRATETDETNNEKEIKFATKTPDLAIDNINWLMENPLTDNEVTFTITIKNQGTDTAGTFKLAYSIDSNPDLYKDVKPITAGTKAAITFVTNLEAGKHTANITADADNKIIELDETNNNGLLSFSTIAPDLAIKTITLSPADAAVGNTITVSVKLENRGRDKALRPRLTLNVDNVSIGYVDIDKIDSGASVTQDFPWTAQAGQHEIKAIADIDGLILESNESNNTKSRTITIGKPEAPITKPAKISSSTPADKGFIGNFWWMILLVAALLGGTAFIMAFKSFKKN